MNRFGRFDGPTAAENLTTLQEALRAILRNVHNAYSYEDLYSRAYRLVLDRHEAQIEHTIRTACSEHLRSSLYPKLVQALNGSDASPASDADTGGSTFLSVLLTEFEASVNAFRNIASVCMYYDSHRFRDGSSSNGWALLPRQGGGRGQHDAPSLVMTLCMIQLRECCFLNDSSSPNEFLLAQKLSENMLDTVAKFRSGAYLPDRACTDVQGACEILMGLGISEGKCFLPDREAEMRRVYSVFFEKPFLLQSAELFALEAEDFFQYNRNCDSILEFVQVVHDRIEKEKLLAARCLHPSSEPALVRAVKVEMVEKYATKVLVMLRYDEDASALATPSQLDTLRKISAVLYTSNVAGGISEQLLTKFFEIFKTKFLQAEAVTVNMPNNDHYTEHSRKSELQSLRNTYKSLCSQVFGNLDENLRKRIMKSSPWLEPGEADQIEQYLRKVEGGEWNWMRRAAVRQFGAE